MKDGTFGALDTQIWLNTGAYATFGTDLVGVCGACGTAGAYEIPNFHFLGWPVYTNQMTAGAFRGFGSPQGNAVVEPAIEMMAQKLGMDSLELRKMNSTKEDSKNWFPFPPGSAGMNECLDKAAASIGWKEKHGRAAEQSGKIRRGVGISGGTHVSNAAPFCVDYNTVMLRVEADGTLYVNSSMPEIGPGSTTACLQVAAAHDVGRVVNPKLCKGQVEGGILQGVGYAVREEMSYVEGKGFYNKGFHSYMLPTADDCPEMDVMLVENPDPSGVFGIIGIGECGVNPTLAAIGNAVEDATGVRFHEFPLTPERVLAGLKMAKQ